MYQKVYEIQMHLVALHRGELLDSDCDSIIEFLERENSGALDLEVFNEIKQSLIEKAALDSETVYLRSRRLMDYMDFLELRLLSRFMDYFLELFPKPKYEAFRVILQGARLLIEGGMIHITQRSYPRLFNVLSHIEDYERAYQRLMILRSQMSELVREAGGRNIPLWEIIVQLTVLHCAHDKIEGEKEQLYNIIFKFARSQLSNLSFQQVMRLCNQIRSVVSEQNGVHLLFLAEVENNLDFTTRRQLLESLMELDYQQKRTKAIPELDDFCDAVIAATRFGDDDLGRIKFKVGAQEEDLPVHFSIFELKEKEKVSLGYKGSQLIEIEDPVMIEVESLSEEEILIKKIDSQEEMVLKEGEECYIDDCCILAQPKNKRICSYFHSHSDLIVDNVSLRFRENTILKDITLSARSGEMIAVVGPSGCGKSTMCTMLSGIMEYTSGNVYFNRKKVKSIDDFSAISTYIPQDDILYRELTVHESIDSSVRLKVKAKESERQQRLKQTIDVLGLERTEHLKIGSEEEKGISGGQRKRVNIGTTIVADMKPILLFDEPTSGLDPATDLEIMQLLRVLSRRGHIVFCVTHNLSDESISYFDKVMVLSKNGQVVFFGKKQRLLYFMSISGPQYLFQKMGENRHFDYHDKFLKSPESHNLEESVSKETRLIQNKLVLQKRQLGQKTELPGFLSNLKDFFCREMRRKSRDRQFLGMCMIQPLLIALFISWNFAGPLPNGLFSLLTAVLWIGSISGVREINGEWPQLKRDYLYGTSIAAYFLSKVASIFSFSAFQIVLLTSIVVFNGGYCSEPFRFEYFSLITVLLLLNLFGICLGLFMSGAIKSQVAAVGVLPVLLIPLVIMGGALIRHEESRGLQRQVMSFNPLRIAFEASIFTSDYLLRPRLPMQELKTPDEAKKERKAWEGYLEKKAKYEENKDEYQTKEDDVNALFMSALSKSNEVAPVPPDVESIELNVHKEDLWLDGYTLLPVDKPLDANVWSYGSGNAWKHYPITAPRKFSESLSAQGATGMYVETQESENSKDLIAMSVYSPSGYFLWIIFEIFALAGLTLLSLKSKLARQFN